MGKIPMLWGCIKKMVKKKLVKTGDSLNNAKYIQLVKEHLIADINEGEIF